MRIIKRHCSEKSVCKYVRRNFGMKIRYGDGTIYTIERSFSGPILRFLHMFPLLFLHKNSLNERMNHISIVF